MPTGAAAGWVDGLPGSAGPTPFVVADGSADLRTPPYGHDCAIARHPDAGDVAVHQAHAEGMTVTSVIAASDVPADVVLDAAHDAGAAARPSLFDLPLGPGHAWTITESDGPDREERLEAVLSAWSAPPPSRPWLSRRASTSRHQSPAGSRTHP